MAEPGAGQSEFERAGWIPPVLLLLLIPTVLMVLLALGVIFDVLPDISGPGSGSLVAANKILPIVSTAVGVLFVTAIFRRYAAKGGTHLLVWGIGLVFFATGSLTESLYGLFGWEDLFFRFWYLFGAVLIAAWMGQGTIHLLASRRTALIVLAVLIPASAFAAWRVWGAELDPTNIGREVVAVETSTGSADELLFSAAVLLQETARDDDGTISARHSTPLIRALVEAAGIDEQATAIISAEGAAPNTAGAIDEAKVVVGHPDWIADNGIQPAVFQSAENDQVTIRVAIEDGSQGRITLEPAIFLSGHAITSEGVRSLTPYFNIFGTITLIGGAIWSSWVFWRKRIMLNRAIGNVLIAFGAIVGGGASAFSRFGIFSFLYLAELTSLLIMFAGFLIATRTAPMTRKPNPTHQPAQT